MKTEIHFVGLGNAGKHIAEYFHSKRVSGSYSVVTHPDKITQTSDIENILYCHDVEDKIERRRMELQNHTVESIHLITNEIKQLFEYDTRYVLLSGLGKYMGTNLTLQLTDYLISKERKFHVLCSTPFAFEGDNTNDYAKIALKKLLQITNPKVISLNGLRKKYGNMKLAEAYDRIDNEFLEEFEKVGW